MKLSYLFIFFTYSILAFSARTMELSVSGDFLEQYRPGNNLPTIESNSLPRPSSLEDGFQLCESLIKSTIDFWQESQNIFAAENPEVKIIVNLLNTNKMNIGLRLDIFLKNPKYSDLYSMFKSYSTIIENLNKIYEQLTKSNYSKEFNTYQDRINFIDDVRVSLISKAKENEKKALLRRALIQSPQKSQGSMIQEQRGRFQAPLSDGPAKYAFCDVEYVREVFAPMLNKILQLTREAISQKAQEEEKDIKKEKLEKEKATQEKKKGRKNRKKHRNTGTQPPLEQKNTKSKSAPLKEEMSSEDHLVLIPKNEEKINLYTASRQPEKTQEEDQDIIQIFPDATQQPQESGFSIAEALNAQENLSLVAKVPEAQGDIVTIPTASELAEADGLSISRIEGPEHSETYDLTPWKAYENQPSKITITESKADHALPPVLLLSEECSIAARTLLGLDKSTALDKVSMAIYIQMVNELGGVAINHPKSVHFMARSLLTGLWHSVAMHRLHQDDPHIIPRNTRYWKIAKQLLTDIGLSEANLTS